MNIAVMVAKMSATLSEFYPTDPPTAADVELRLARRQGLPQTCGWINADPSKETKPCVKEVSLIYM